MVDGGLLVMKPEFDKMSRSELKTYVLKHRNDMEALRALMSRRSPDDRATWYKFPDTEEGIKQMEEVFRKRLGG